MKNCMIDYACISERILWVRLKIKLQRVVVVVAYAPCDAEPSEKKDEFWDELNIVLGQFNPREKVTVAGDLNARVGTKSEISDNVLGRFNDPSVNGNSERLIEVCIENGLYISNTFFKHKYIHTYTWENRTAGQKSVIDFIIYDQRLKSLVMDTRVVRGADVGTDHYLIISHIKLNLGWRKRVKKRAHAVSRVKVERLYEQRELYSELLDERLRKQTECG